MTPAYLRAIPHLAACGVFRYENGKARVDIPVISKAAYQEMDRLRIDAMNRLAEVLTERRFGIGEAAAGVPVRF